MEVSGVDSLVVAVPFWGVVPLYALAFLAYAWASFSDRRRWNV